MLNHRNTVFPAQDFASLVSDLQDAQAAGFGAVATKPFTTVANTYWGIDAGFTVSVTWVYLSKAWRWEQGLPDAMKQEFRHDPANFKNPLILPKDGNFRSFPHYPTSEMLKLTVEQSSLLADLSGWVVLQHEDKMNAALGWRGPKHHRSHHDAEL